MLVAKKLEHKKQENLQDSIKLFDFDQNAEINRNMLMDDGSEQGGKPLDQPKIYMNLLYHDKVVPPLNKERKPAHSTDDKEWAIIPISFAPSKERWSGSGMKCIHIDAYVNSCVFTVFKQSTQKIGSITNYILQKL